MNVGELKRILDTFPDYWPVEVEFQSAAETLEGETRNLLGAERSNVFPVGNSVTLIVE
jgi:hypothetical protein